MVTKIELTPEEVGEAIRTYMEEHRDIRVDQVTFNTSKVMHGYGLGGREFFEFAGATVRVN